MRISRRNFLGGFLLLAGGHLFLGVARAATGLAVPLSARLRASLRHPFGALFSRVTEEEIRGDYEAGNFDCYEGWYLSDGEVVNLRSPDARS